MLAVLERHADPVEVVEQRDEVFACNSKRITEIRGPEIRLSTQLGADSFDGIRQQLGVHEHAVGDGLKGALPFEPPEQRPDVVPPGEGYALTP